MSSKKRKQKQHSIYLDQWLKVLAESKATELGLTFSGYLRGLIKSDLEIKNDYHPMDVVIEKLESGVTLVGLKGGNSDERN